MSRRLAFEIGSHLMNHLLNLNVLSAIFGSDGWLAWWQVLLILVLIGLVVMLVIIRKRGQ